MAGYTKFVRTVSTIVETTRKVTGYSTIIDKLIDLWLWFIAIAILVLGFCTAIAWVGAIILFIASFIKGN